MYLLYYVTLHTYIYTQYLLVWSVSGLVCVSAIAINFQNVPELQLVPAQ